MIKLKYFITLSNYVREFNNSSLNLVFVHGLMGSKSNFRSLCSNERLTSKAKSIHLLDIRNHGDSPHTPTMSLKEMAEDLVE